MTCRLLSADMRTLVGKLDALVAVVNMTRALCSMSKVLPAIAWGHGQALERKLANNTVISTVTNMGGACTHVCAGCYPVPRDMMLLLTVQCLQCQHTMCLTICTCAWCLTTFSLCISIDASCCRVV